jgi:hypothetical protein
MQQHDPRFIGARISFYNHHWARQALGMKTSVVT